MRTNALIRRLQVMGPAEASRRVFRRLGSRWIAGRIEREAEKFADPRALESLFDTPVQAEPGRDEGDGVNDALILRAEAALAGKLTVCGRGVELGGNPDWLAEPHGEGHAGELEKLPAWSERYPATGIDIRAIWELNRLQPLVDLGRAWRLTGRDEFAECAARWFSGWSEQNPFGMTVNWASSLEVALRSVSMLLAVNCLRDSEPFRDEQFRALLARQFCLHGQYVDSHLSPASSAFNHLAGESAALALLGELLPGLPPAANWRIEGLALLRQCMHRLILPDGGGLEGSLHYSAFVCRLTAVTVMLLGRSMEDVLGREGADRLRAAYRFLCEMTDGGGAISEYGDSDDASFPGPPPAEPASRYKSTLNLIWLITGDNTLYHDFEPDPDSLWLFGAENIRQRLEGARQAGREPLVSFPSGGHHVIRPAPGVFARFECGHWGDGATWAHSHADRLSFSLFLGGHPVLVDPGTGAYLNDKAMRDYFRSSLAHSPAVVDGVSQGTALATFMWDREIESSLLETALTGREAVLEGRLDSAPEADSDDPVIHSRRLCFYRNESRLVVEDFFRTGGDHRVEILFNLHPSCQAEPDGGGAGEVRITAGRQVVRLRPDAGCRTVLRRGEKDPLRGWYSAGFGRIEPSWQAVVEAEISGNSWIKTELSWAALNRK